MEKLVIYGAGGFGREVAKLVEDINKNGKVWDILGFIEDNSQRLNEQINGYPILGGYEWIKEFNDTIYVAIAVGLPSNKRVILGKLRDIPNVKFPKLVHPSVDISGYENNIQNAVIICEGVVLTCNIYIGSFVNIDRQSTLGHDVIIDDYVTVSPNSTISGNVHINENSYIGAGAIVIEKINIGCNSIIGAGSVVIRDIPNNTTAVGNPAKPIKYSK